MTVGAKNVLFRLIRRILIAWLVLSAKDPVSCWSPCRSGDERRTVAHWTESEPQNYDGRTQTSGQQHRTSHAGVSGKARVLVLLIIPYVGGN